MKNGKLIPYSFETALQATCEVAGVVMTMFNVGDVVTIEAAAAKDGTSILAPDR